MVAAAAPVKRYGLAPAAQQHFAPAASGISRIFALGAFTFLLAFNIALSTLKLGSIPIRGILALAMLGLVAVLYADVAKLVLRRNLLFLGLATGLAILGLVVSVVNDAAPADIIAGLSEVHVQAAVTLMVTAILAQICGGRACMIAIVAVIGASACVAAAQMLDIQAAWDLRRAFGPLRNEAISGILDRRPMGLSFTPIQLSTHLCLAFAAFTAVRDKLSGRGRNQSAADPAVILALLALIATSIACATRSPILGGLIFMAIYSVHRRTTWLALFLILAAILIYMAWPLLIGAVDTHAPRVTKVDDNSAAARITMAYYGLRLFADNPVGYGLAFEPMNLWFSYWPDLYTMPAPEGVQVHDLHNYVFSMLNIYGIGILLLAPVIIKLLRGASASLIFFVPYIVHILFHNSGPFYNDSVIWFVIAAVAAAGSATADAGLETEPGTGVSGTRRVRLTRATSWASTRMMQRRHHGMRPPPRLSRRG